MGTVTKSTDEPVLGTYLNLYRDIVILNKMYRGTIPR